MSHFWKEPRKSVFYVGILLAVLCFLLLLSRGFLELVMKGDPWFLVIDLIGLAILVAALQPGLRHLRSASKGKP